MKIVADLHLHSKYSRAVSKHMELVTIAQWAVKKGIDLITVPDWTHPIFLKESEILLKERNNGVYQLKEGNNKTGFILSTEISSIYSQGGKGRRIHNLIMAPSFSVVHKINDELKKRGCNLMSDGRPIIGLSSIQLAELVFGVDDKCLIVPAHIWTPWFAMFGSKSGFDSIKECWENYANKIYGVETGLSSDPGMNWQVGDLDNRSILSFSDAHSPAKIGREATVFSAKNKQDKKDFSFTDLSKAIKQDKDRAWEIAYTIEFYPEEGKYHWTGHRNCGISFSPEDTKKKGVICPVCGKSLTVGVEHRVQDLATHKIKKLEKTNKNGLIGYYNQQNTKRPPYIMIVPLQEIIAEALGVKSVHSVKVQAMYEKLVSELAPEFELLTQVEISKIKNVGGARIAEGIARVRSANIVVKPGFDGEFGVVKIWGNDKDQESNSNTEKSKKEQMTLFS